MYEASSPKVSNRTRYLQRFGVAALGTFVSQFFWVLIFSSLTQNSILYAIQLYISLLFTFGVEAFLWVPIILAVAVGRLAKRPIIGFGLAFLISVIGMILITMGIMLYNINF